MNGLWHDVRYALRMLARAPGHSALCIVVLAMGIALVTMQYSLVDATLLRPLPYDPAGRLYNLGQVHPLEGDRQIYRNLEASWLEKTQKSFDWLSAVPGNQTGWEEARDGENWMWLNCTWVTPDLMEQLGYRPMIGRGFAPEDYQPGGTPVAMLTHRCWKENFAGRPEIVGQRIRLSGVDYTIIGVTAADAEYPGRNDLWKPFQPGPKTDQLGLSITARLKDDVSPAAMQEELSRLSSQYNQEQSIGPDKTTRWHAKPLQDVLVGDDRGMLLMMLLAVGLVLVMTCANVSNLLLVRAMQRSKELALRSVLGADRGRIIRQMLTESLVLSAIGAVPACCWRPAASIPHRPYWDWMVPSWAAPAVNLPVVLSISGIVVVAAVLTGLVPAWRASRVHVNDVLKEDTRTASGRHLGWLSRMSVLVQVTLSVALLVVAGTCVSHIQRINHHRLPFNPRQVLSVRVGFPAEAYANVEAMRRESGKLEQAFRAAPDVPRFALTTRVNMRRPEPGAFAQVPGRPPVPATEGNFNCRFSFVGGDYFAAMGVPLQAGREFNDMDTVDSEPVTIIDRPFADRFFPNDNPIGQIVETGRAKMRVVGVVPCLYLGGLKPDESGLPGLYRPMSQVIFPSGVWVMVGAGNDPKIHFPALRNAVKAYDPQSPPPSIDTLQDMIEGSTWYQTNIATLFGVFSAVSLLLAMIGTYGVLSFAVTQRTREMGIRMALGASPLGILRLVMAQGARQMAIGLFLGLVLGWVLLRVMGNVVGGVYPEPMVYPLVAGLLGLTGIMAMLIPSWRAVESTAGHRTQGRIDGQERSRATSMPRRLPTRCVGGSIAAMSQTIPATPDNYLAGVDRRPARSLAWQSDSQHRLPRP